MAFIQPIHYSRSLPTTSLPHPPPLTPKSNLHQAAAMRFETGAFPTAFQRQVPLSHLECEGLLDLASPSLQPHPLCSPSTPFYTSTGATITLHTLSSAHRVSSPSLLTATLRGFHYLKACFKGGFPDQCTLLSSARTGKHPTCSPQVFIHTSTTAVTRCNACIYTPVSSTDC